MGYLQRVKDVVTPDPAPLTKLTIAEAEPVVSFVSIPQGEYPETAAAKRKAAILSNILGAHALPAGSWRQPDPPKSYQAFTVVLTGKAYIMDTDQPFTQQAILARLHRRFPEESPLVLPLIDTPDELGQQQWVGDAAPGPASCCASCQQGRYWFDGAAWRCCACSPEPKGYRSLVGANYTVVAGPATSSYKDFSQEPGGYVYTEALNTPVQGAAAMAMVAALLQVDAALAGLDARLVNLIHDELVLEVTAADVEPAKRALVDGMTAGFMAIFPDAGTRDLVDAHDGDNWDTAKG